MVIKNPDAAEYIEPLKKLFPQGEYWDKLLSDEASDISLVCKVRAENLAEFKARMNQLQRETFLDLPMRPSTTGSAFISVIKMTTWN